MSFIIRARTGAFLLILASVIFNFAPAVIRALCCGLLSFYAIYYELIPLTKNLLYLSYFTSACTLATILAYQHHTALALLALCAIIFDSCAYISGTLWGKHPISSISPRKTWEGTFGGFIGLLIFLYFFKPHQILFFNNLYLNTLLWGTSAFVGDLIESHLKRTARVKDSATIITLPGHGGILDRFDSLLCNIIVYAFLKTVFI